MTFPPLWFLEQISGFKTLAHTFTQPFPPKEYTSKNLSQKPVIVIPGIMQKWNIFRELIPFLIEQGHPVYIVKDLKRNLNSIEHGASLVNKVIVENNLEDVILIGHSKGGLIGKYVLMEESQDNKIHKLIAIATPFAGSQHAKNFPIKIHKQLIPNANILVEMNKRVDVNQKISSIYSKHDNAVKPITSCILPGAKNTQLKISGHHQIMFKKETFQAVINELKN